MLKPMQCVFMLTLLSVVTSCAKAPQTTPQVQTSPSFSVVAPINKAKQAATTVRQKGLAQEQLDPQTQVEPSPSPN